MGKKLPPEMAALAIVEKRLRADLIAMHVVQQEAIALLIADLHARGSVDGLALADRMTQHLTQPELIAELPALASLAPDAAACVRRQVLQGGASSG